MTMSKNRIVGFRATEEQSVKLGTMADLLNLSQSEVLRALVDGAEIKAVQIARPVATVQQAQANSKLREAVQR
jgi:hypothetical protein